MNCCCSLLKYIVFIVNFFVTLGGLALLVLATWGLITINKGVLGNETEGVNSLYWAFVVMIVLGIIMTVVGFLGCCGASRESQCLLATYSVVMLIGIGLAVAGTVMVNREKENIIVQVRKFVEKIFVDLNRDGKTNAAIALQEVFQCCGANGYSDWKLQSLSGQFPSSCCVDQKGCPNPFENVVNLTFGLAGNKYHDGCVQVAEKSFRWMVDHSPVILGIAIAIQAIAFIISLLVCCAIRNNTYKTTVY